MTVSDTTAGADNWEKWQTTLQYLTSSTVISLLDWYPHGVGYYNTRISFHFALVGQCSCPLVLQSSNVNSCNGSAMMTLHWQHHYHSLLSLLSVTITDVTIMSPNKSEYLLNNHDEHYKHKGHRMKYMSVCINTIYLLHSTFNAGKTSIFFNNHPALSTLSEKWCQVCTMHREWSN